ncbi:MAG: MBL fold metallo-hydrolase [Paludibacteraceae bacterium]|nr:MBL fold metallo-hydrolase [Paludibacteraceae bacterium]
MDKLRFISFASGSSGNCYFIGNAVHGILIDAGIGVRTIKKRLKEIGIDFSQILGVFVTHDHIDHIKAVGALGEVHHIPIYATRLVHEGISKSYGVTVRLNASRKYVEKNETISVFDFHVTPFAVSHDGTDNVGYTITYQGKRFTVATDLGYISDQVALHIKRANYLVIEANYDEQMLLTGHYPAYLKSRVASKTGHLDNKETAEFLSENYHEGLDYIYLCHLSKDNNTPQKAHDEVQHLLEEKGIVVGQQVQLFALERTTPSELFIFE